MAKKSELNQPKHETLTKSISLKIVKFFVAAIWYLGCFAAVLVLGLIAIVIAGLTPDNLHMEVPVRIDYVEGGDDHEWIEFENRPAIISVVGKAKVNVRPLGKARAALILNFLALSMVLFLWAVYQLRQIIKSLSRGDPFDSKNPTRLRRIGAVTLVAGPVIGTSQLVQGVMQVGDLNIPGAEIGLHFEPHPELIFVGLIFLVIAQVFDVAAKMQKNRI